MDKLSLRAINNILSKQFGEYLESKHGKYAGALAYSFSVSFMAIGKSIIPPPIQKASFPTLPEDIANWPSNICDQSIMTCIVPPIGVYGGASRDGYTVRQQ